MGKFRTIHNPKNSMAQGSTVDANYSGIVQNSVSFQTAMVPGVQPLTINIAPIPELKEQNLYQSITNDLIPATKIVEVEKIVYIDRPVEIIKEKIIEVIKEVPVEIEKIVHKIQEIEKPVIKEVEVIKEKIIQIPKIIFRKQVPHWAIALMISEGVIIALVTLMKHV